MEINSGVAGTRPEGSIESGIITGRRLSQYEKLLGFKRELLRDTSVLNFGSGGSNIGKDLLRSGIHANVVDVDLAFDPQRNAYLSSIIRLVDSFTDPGSAHHNKLVEIKRVLGGTSGRKIVQADGRSLPFADQTFDEALALLSTYQVPVGDRQKVFSELLRVSNTLHCGPIFKNDFHTLKQLASENDFSLIYCLPLTIPRKERIQIARKQDYDNYASTHLYEDRVKEPTDDGPRVIKILNKPIWADMRGSMIVMRRDT